MENGGIRQAERTVLLNIADSLLEKGLITEKERDTMKNIINCEICTISKS